MEEDALCGHESVLYLYLDELEVHNSSPAALVRDYKYENDSSVFQYTCHFSFCRRSEHSFRRVSNCVVD